MFINLYSLMGMVLMSNMLFDGGGVDSQIHRHKASHVNGCFSDHRWSEQRSVESNYDHPN